MIQSSKLADERREAGSLECWCLHGTVGLAADWRPFAKRLAEQKIGSRAVDLWRFLECKPLPISEFGETINSEASGEARRGGGQILLGYSMGGRLALHALLESNGPWQAAVIISTHPGLESSSERSARRASDVEWASKALTGNWQEFLATWNAQPVFGKSTPPPAHASGNLAMRRREISRSFVDWSLGNQEPLWHRLHEIRVPVLWVAGENDLKFRQLAERACALIPHARLAIAPACGHRVLSDAEAWLAAEVVNFLS